MKASPQVLVVDEDTDQLQTLCRGLHYLGMACIPARTSTELEGYLGGKAGEQIDLLLADLTFPGGRGARLVEAARALRPGLKVLLVVGLKLSTEVQALRRQGVPILRKPFGPAELERAIEAAFTELPWRSSR